VSQLGIVLLTTSVSAVAGVLAWIGTNFFAEPILYFHKRRRAVRETMLYAANVRADQPDAFTSAVEELRRHAAAMDALDETAPQAVKALLSWRGFDMSEAKTGLFGFAHNLANYDGSREVFRKRVRKALRFRRDF
jgi:hypothetical protein